MWRTIALGLGCLGLTGCSGPSGGGGDGPAPAKDPLDVYEAVFRYRLQNHPRDVRAYLSVDGRDLPADLLRRCVATGRTSRLPRRSQKKKGCGCTSLS